MVKKKTCDTQFFFDKDASGFGCDLDKGHRGVHVAKGCMETQNWEFSWTQEQFGLKVEKEV